MRNHSEAPGGTLRGAGEAGKEQLELWRGAQPPVPRSHPTAKYSGAAVATRHLDPLQLSLEVAGATR